MTKEKMWRTNYMDDYNKKTKASRKSYKYGRKTTPASTNEVPATNPYASSAEIYKNSLLDGYAAECEAKWGKKGQSICRPDSALSRPSTSMGFNRNFQTPQPPVQSSTNPARPRSSISRYRGDAERALYEYFKRLAVQDGEPQASSNLPLFLDPSGGNSASYQFPENLNDATKHYMYSILKAADDIRQKQEEERKQKAKNAPPKQEVTETKDDRPETAVPPVTDDIDDQNSTDESENPDVNEQAKSKRRSILKKSFPTTFYPTLTGDDEQTINVFGADFDNIATGPTPVPPEPPKEKPGTPDPIRDWHWLCWPEPPAKEPVKRPHTSHGIRGESKGPDQIVWPNQGDPSNRGPPMQFVPDLQSWINAVSQYDKDFIYRMMQTMNLPAISQSPFRKETAYNWNTPRPSSTVPLPDPKNPYAQRWVGGYSVPQGQSGVELGYPLNWFQFNGANSPLQFPQLQRANTDLNMFARQRMGNNRLAMTEDYTHEHSMFMTTQPLCRGHFIIHPDWVSERIRRKPIVWSRQGKSRQGLRYGTPAK